MSLVIHQLGKRYGDTLGVLPGVSSPWRPASLWPSWANRAWASPACSTAWRRWTIGTRARSPRKASTWARLDEVQRAHWRREKLGFVFQAFHVLPHLDVAQNVGLPLLLLNRPDPERVARTCWPRWAGRAWASACPPSSRVASFNGWPLPARWSTAPPAAGRRAHGQPGSRNGRAGDGCAAATGPGKRRLPAAGHPLRERCRPRPPRPEAHAQRLECPEPGRSREPAGQDRSAAHRHGVPTANTKTDWCHAMLCIAIPHQSVLFFAKNAVTYRLQSNLPGFPSMQSFASMLEYEHLAATKFRATRGT